MLSVESPGTSLQFGHPNEVISINKDYRHILTEKRLFDDFIEEFYPFWRRFERFVFIEAPERSQFRQEDIHHAQFIKSNEEFKNLVLTVYRSVSENLLGIDGFEQKGPKEAALELFKTIQSMTPPEQ